MFSPLLAMRLWVLDSRIWASKEPTPQVWPLVSIYKPVSYTSRPFFPSFFFHNAQWLRCNLKSFPQDSLSFPPPPSTAFKEVEHLTLKNATNTYLQLSKSRLTTLVVLTAMSGVALSPYPTTLPVLLSTAFGTALCSASANTLNQLQEIPFDAQMMRTRTRPLVRRVISPLHAASFAALTGAVGPTILWFMVNPTTALLGAGNIFLYAGIYTWMKRRSIMNTWVGSIVGALPPLMGWAACDPHALSSFSIQDVLPPLALCMLLFSWQFPHFNSLSHLVRGSYAQAGYHMLSVTEPSRNALVSLRHALWLIPVCSILVPVSGLTTWIFAITTLIPNLICVRSAWLFSKRGGESEARQLFRHSLWYLPVILGLMMVHKEGVEWLQWVGIWKV
ncbi:hypothetical protein AMATHDRAFT_78071 [Amanita thiersii Skay4041]|uniref:Protoheme IX farnesyltransferase, mitochondrial n=1 Tax=Amanita thiersii Skay4041 TaxID=703135 RepID=A0A2A9NAG8_9AGAR|nr:hypothetical protein AMATHDRAFT_78071 [Amanita thiersii Skay4041]